MERKEIIVKTYEQLVRAVEILEADIIIVSGMIAQCDFFGRIQ